MNHLADSHPPSGDGRPVLRVIKGEPSDAELAALLAVVLSRTAPPARRPHHPGWADRAARLRRALPAGPGGWRTSSWR